LSDFRFAPGVAGRVSGSTANFGAGALGRSPHSGQSVRRTPLSAIVLHVQPSGRERCIETGYSLESTTESGVVAPHRSHVAFAGM